MKPIFARKPEVVAVVEPKECSPEEKVYQLLQDNPAGLSFDEIKSGLSGLGMEGTSARKILNNLRLAHRVFQVPGGLWFAAKDAK